MPINVRYGSAADLGELAVQTGKGQEFLRRMQIEQQQVAAVRQDYARQDAQRLEAMRFQQAAAMQRSYAARSSTPSGGRAQRMGPMAAGIKAPTEAPSLAGFNREQQNIYNEAVRVGDRDTVGNMLKGLLSKQDEKVSKARLTAGDRTIQYEEGDLVERDPAGKEIQRVPGTRRQSVNPVVDMVTPYMKMSGITPQLRGDLQNIMDNVFDVDQAEAMVKDVMDQRQSPSAGRLEAGQDIGAIDNELRIVSSRITSQERSLKAAKEAVKEASDPYGVVETTEAEKSRLRERVIQEQTALGNLKAQQNTLSKEYRSVAKGASRRAVSPVSSPVQQARGEMMSVLKKIAGGG